MTQLHIRKQQRTTQEYKSRWKQVITATALALSVLLIHIPDAAAAWPETTDPPVAENDWGEPTGMNGPILVYVLDNDYSELGLDADTLSVVTEPDNGEVIIDYSMGTLEYRADEGFHGYDSFQYVVDDYDSQTSNVATVYVYVPPPAPVVNALAATEISANTWHVYGTVQHYDPESLTIEFGELLTGYTAEVASNGSFEITVILPPSVFGEVTAETIDEREYPSNVASTYIAGY